jgi:pimeloyl-ACP methyl ester carboxylesterase
MDTARLRDARRIRNPLVVSLGAWRWRDSVAAITAPTLVIEGAGEPIVEGSARRWAQHVPGARLLLMPRPYLFPWVGAPGQFRRSVEAFLDGNWPEGAVIPEPFAPEALPDSTS